MPPFDHVGYILIHKGRVERQPSPLEWASRKKRNPVRRLVNWLTGRSPDSH